MIMFISYTKNIMIVILVKIDRSEMSIATEYLPLPRRDEKFKTATAPLLRRDDK